MTLPIGTQLLIIVMAAYCGVVMAAIGAMIYADRQPLPALRYRGRARVPSADVGAEATAPLRTLSAAWHDLVTPPPVESLFDGLVVPVIPGRPMVGRHRAGEA